LAGPITGLNYAGATDWRGAVTRELLPYVIGVSPMRGKHYLKDKTEIGGTSADFTAMKQALSTPQAIVCRDRWDVQTCDAVLMNVLGAERVSIGTMIEAGWADAARKPVILVIEPTGNVHEHGMLDQLSGYRVPTLDEAVHIAKMLFWKEA
jgi:hypothetical protein